MKIKDILNESKTKLKESKIEDADIIAKEIICYVLNVDYNFLIINLENEIEDDKCILIKHDIEEIISGKPVQYITNHQEFMGLDFFVNENVLIPQPDTETLVECCLEIINKNKICKILDLCTGSGAIAISLDKKIEKYDNIKIYGADISEFALDVAIKNRDKLKSNIEFIHSDMFTNINEKFDLIVSNPPYIKREEIKSLAKDVQQEPLIALDGGLDGLDFYRVIKNEAKNYLNKNGYICLEIGYDQANDVKKLFEEDYKGLKIIKDLSNNDRCVVCQYCD